MANSQPLRSAQYDTIQLAACGDDVFISSSVEIRRPHLVRIGSHVAIDSGVYLTTAAEIGDYTHLSPYLTIIGGAQSTLIVEDFVTIAAGSRFICGSDRFMGDGFTSVTAPEEFRDTVDFGTIRCSRFAGIGTNVVVMPNVTIGRVASLGLLTRHQRHRALDGVRGRARPPRESAPPRKNAGVRQAPRLLAA